MFDKIIKFFTGREEGGVTAFEQDSEENTLPPIPKIRPTEEDLIEED